MARQLLPEVHLQTEDQYRCEVCRVGRWMYERGYIVAYGGNLSVRLDAGRILTTPTCMNKGMMSPDDLVIVDTEGRHIKGKREVSSEAAIHLLFYRMRPDVQAVCDGHPVASTGFAAAGLSLTETLVLDKVPLVRYATSGNSDLCAALEPYIPHNHTFLLANHGAVTCGPDLLTAFFRMEILEHSAKTMLSARLVEQPHWRGGALAILLAARARGHEASHPCSRAELSESCLEDRDKTNGLL